MVLIGLFRSNRERRLTFRCVVIEKWMYIAQVPLDNALVLDNLCEYRHKWYIAKTTFFGLHFSCRLYRSIFDRFDVIGPKLPNSVKKTQDNGHHAVQGHSRSPILVPIKSLCDFLLVINANLHRILHRFEVIADWWNLRFRQRGTPL